MKKNLLRSLYAAATAAALAFALHAGATPPRPWACECADIDAPVICSNGVVYNNQCVADCWHATDCQPYIP